MINYIISKKNKNISKLLFSRHKHGKLFVYLYFPLMLIFTSIYLIVPFVQMYPIDKMLSTLILIIATGDSMLFYFLLINKSTITHNNIFQYPISNFNKLNHILSQIFYLRIFFYLVPMIIVFISMIVNNQFIVGVVFIIIFIININLLQIVFNVLSLLIPKKLLNANFPMIVMFILIIAYQAPLFTKNYELYNLYPISGWISSTTNAAISGQWGSVAIYFCISIIALFMAALFYSKLLEPRKSIRY